jgi:hypothetical protein
MQRVVIMQRAGNGACGECVMNRVGAYRTPAVQSLAIPLVQVAIGRGGAIAAKTAAAGGTRERRRPSARCM